MTFKDYSDFIWGILMLFVGLACLSGLFTSHPQW